MGSPSVRLKSISKGFLGTQALREVSFEVERGKVHCVIGENGAGKSTLMKILSGAYSLDSGEIEIEGNRARIDSPIDALRHGIGIVYQELSNFPHLTVADNLFANRFPVRSGLIRYGELRRKARRLLDDLGLDHIPENARMGSLSLGAQQMVEIAGLLSRNVRIVILDEPTSALTDVEVDILFRLIADLKTRGITVIYISHRLGEILSLADSITVLKDGEHVATFENGPEVSRETLVRHMVGRDVEYDYGAGTREIGEALMEVRGLSGGGAVKDVSFDVRRGEILGVAGLEGAGRTELLETLFGWRRGEAGTVRIRGRAADIRSPMDAKKWRMAYITKERKLLGLFLPLDIRNNMAAASLDRHSSRGIVRHRRMAENARHYMAAMRVRASGTSQRAATLSGGNQQKVLLAMWLAVEPDVILIDEPTRGIDVGAKAEIHKLLRELAGQGRAVVMVSSELPEIIASCDRVLVMHEGRIMADLPNSGLTEERLMHYASGGE